MSSSSSTLSLTTIMKQCTKTGLLLCNKRGCPVHDRRNVAGVAKAGIKASGKAASADPTKTAKLPVRRTGHAEPEALERLTKLTKSAGVGKTATPKKLNSTIHLEVTGTVLKPTTEKQQKKLRKPAAADEVTTPIKPAPAPPVVSSPPQPIDTSSPLSSPPSQDSTSQSTSTASTGSPTCPASTRAPATRRHHLEYGQKGFAIPKGGVRKRRKPSKPRGKTAKQQVERFLKL